MTDTKTLLEELQKNNDDEKRAELRKQVQKVLPILVDGKDFCDLASFLKVNEHQSSAISHLETLLLDLRNRYLYSSSIKNSTSCICFDSSSAVMRCLYVSIVFSHGVLRPQKPQGLSGTWEGWDRE